LSTQLFESSHVEELYRRYRVRGDKVLEGDIHEQASALIGAIAASVDGATYDDLYQEGHVKLNEVLRRGMYDPQRGSMYSFLSRVLTNHMISEVRGQRTLDMLDDDTTGANGVAMSGGTIDVNRILDYGIARFASVTPDRHMLDDIINYNIRAILESCADGYRGAVRTIVALYSLDRAIVNTIYFSILSIIRMECMGHSWYMYADDALSLAQASGATTSLVPEVVLLLGPGLGCVLSMVFRGWFIKL